MSEKKEETLQDDQSEEIDEKYVVGIKPLYTTEGKVIVVEIEPDLRFIDQFHNINEDERYKPRSSGFKKVKSKNSIIM